MKQHFITRFLVFFFSSILIIPSVLAQSAIKTTLVSGPGRDRSEGPAMVCDGEFATKWCVDSPRQMPYTIVLDAGQAASVVEYGLVTGDDTSSYTDRNPVAWRLSGSNDKETWTTLDDQKNNRSMPDEDFQECRFKPQSKGSYRYYRFDFFRVKGGTRIQLSEIFLYNTVQTPVETTFVSGSGSGSKEAQPQSRFGARTIQEGPEMVADGFLFSKWCIDEPSQMPYNVILDAGQPTPISEYRFYTGDDTHSYPERNPITWRVSGSNDKQNWTTLDEQKGNRRLRDENEQEYRFKPAQTGSFRYYRFDFIQMTAGTRLQLSEIKLFK